MPPLVPVRDDMSTHASRRPPRRVSRTATVLTGAAVVVAGSALPVLAAGASTLPASCAEVQTAAPGAPDGDYRIKLAGSRTNVYCAGMAGTSPRAYLSLPNVGGNVNYSSIAPSGIRSDYTRVRVVDNGATVGSDTCTANACVDVNDTTFSASNDSTRSLPFAFAEGDGYQHGYGRADFTGTPFAIDPAGISPQGYDSQGSATYSANNQVVDLDGKGNNGWTSSTTGLLPLVRIATPLMSPTAPTSVTTTRGNSSAQLSFTPGDDGGSPVTGYQVNTGSGFAPLTTSPGPNGTLTGTVTGLTNGTTYSITVRADNAVGQGAVSGPVTVTPATTPTPPTGLTATAADSSAQLSFTPGDDGGSPITGYQVNTGSGFAPLTTSPGPNGTLTGTVTGLTNGTTYTVTVRADNAVGPGAVSNPATVMPVSSDPIAAKYDSLGGPASFLGNAVGPELVQPGGRAQQYQHGWIYWSAATGAHEVHGRIAEHYAALGSSGGLLGYPTTDETATPGGVGRYNHFAGSGGASIYWTPATGAWSVHGAIRSHWASLGWERGVAGYPTTDETATPDGIGRYNHFTGSGGASIYWTPATGAWSVHGAIRDRWISMGWERGRLAYPITDEHAVNGGRRSDFANGTIVYSYATRTTTVTYLR